MRLNALITTSLFIFCALYIVLFFKMLPFNDTKYTLISCSVHQNQITEAKLISSIKRKSQGIESIREGKGVLLFQHIQKVGGTSLSKALEEKIPNKSVKPFSGMVYWYPWDTSLDRYQRLKNFDGIFGHFMFGIHHAILPKSYCYITMLRNPVDRIISLYYYARESFPNPLLGDTLDDFVRFDKNNTFQMHNKDNGMVRSLCGPTAHLVPFLELTEEHLFCAKTHLLEYFSLVLITERYRESLLLLEKTFHWKNLTLFSENKTQRKLSRNKFSAHTISAIERMNKLDLELYEFASNLFDEQLRDILSK